MSPGYRHTPLSQRLGMSFNDAEYWQVDMDNAECFMYFIAGLRQVFQKGEVLYIEGTKIDKELEELYKRFQPEQPQAIMRLMRHPKAKAWHLPLEKEAHKELSQFATCRTFEDICDALLVYNSEKVLMDGSRIGERVALFSGDIPEPLIKKFCATRVNGSYEWVEEG